ncbi:hypothetical protein [Halorubrum laminariae]|uniref:DUF7827 domain-containing protein n=1 Tax=Halorubrum laminariae TaxID=1433523 RepID=A0ABD6C144_9EURY|nr:hypothetical protein [Halorubrum laminariae]
MHTRLALVAAVLLVGLAGVAAPFAAPAAAQSGSAVGFGDSQTTVAQGDVATIDLQLRNTDQATLRIRSADRQYRATLRVVDGDGDGTVRVRANTFRGGDLDDADRFTAESDADTARLLSESSTTDAPVLDTGRYNLIVSTADTSVASVLTLVEPDANDSDAAVVSADGTVSEPATDSNGASESDADSSAGIDADAERESGGSATTEGGERATAAETTSRSIEAARGDRVRTRFDVSGLGGVLESRAPARNLVYPTDSEPTAETTHTVQTTPDETVSVRSLTVDYGVDDSMPPRGVHQFSRGDIEAIGVDETGDGFVDRSAGIAIQNVRTSTDGRMTLTFDRPIAVSENHTFLLSYAMQNPDTSGTEDVSVTLRGSETTHNDRGTVLYGPAGQGTLGNGVDLRPTTVDGDVPTAPLAAVETMYDPGAGGLAATLDTGAFDTGEYAMTLSVGEAAPAHAPRTSLREPFAIVEPSVEFTDRSVGDDPLLSVTADTNLAPGSSVILRVEAEEPNGGISQVLNCVATAGPDGTIGCTFDLQNPASDFDIEVTAQRNDTVIGGPVKYN